jgi:hypothetical protein
MDQRRIVDYFPDWISGGGILSYLNSFDVPWKPEIAALNLDVAYIGRSGDKIISPFLEKMDPDEDMSAIAAAIYAIYGKSWIKLWATLNFDYNPIENYRMVEKMTDDETVTEYGKSSTRTDALQHQRTGTEALGHGLTETRTDNLSHTKEGTETLQHGETESRTDNLSHTKTGTEALQHGATETRTDDLTHKKTGTEGTDKSTTEDDTTNSVWGFNSSSAVPSDKSDHTLAGSEVTTFDTTEKDTGTQRTAKTGTDTTTFNLTEGDTGTQQTVHSGSDTTTYNLSEGDTGTVQSARSGTDTTTYNVTDADTGTQRMADSGSDTQTRNYELTRSGNIGVTTSQQMIQAERELWIWNYFNDVVFRDLDRSLTIQVY